MKTINEYLDDLKEKSGSDNKSAKLLKMTNTAISHIRRRGQLGEETAIKIADLLGIDRSEILIAAAIARSEGEVKQAWLKTANKIGHAATMIMMLNGFFVTSYNDFLPSYTLCEVFNLAYVG
jgi:hypothetical protein